MRGLVRVVVGHPKAWQVALRLAGDDPRRLRVEDDGSVFVANKPRKDEPKG